MSYEQKYFTFEKLKQKNIIHIRKYRIQNKKRESERIVFDWKEKEQNLN